MKASTWVRALVPLLGVIVVAVGCGAGGASNAGSVKVIAVWSGQEQASFMAVLKPFEDSTGIKVQYESTRDEDAILRTRVAAGNAPDLAAAPSPQLLTQFAKDGKVRPLNDAVDMSAAVQHLAGLDQARRAVERRQAVPDLLVGRRQRPHLVRPEKLLVQGLHGAQDVAGPSVPAEPDQEQRHSTVVHCRGERWRGRRLARQRLAAGG